MLCLALGGVCLQVVIGEREDEEERLTLAVLCFYLLFQGGAVYIGSSGSGSFTGCTLSGNDAVSVVSCSWRCAIACCDWREKVK